MTDQELKEDVKNKLRMYNPYTKRIFQLELEIESIEARIFEDTGGSFPKIPEGNQTPNIHRKSPLWEEIRQLENEISMYSITIDQVNNFLEKLNPEQCEIISSMYMAQRKITQEELSAKYSYSREGLRDKVDRWILKYWEY